MILPAILFLAWIMALVRGMSAQVEAWLQDQGLRHGVLSWVSECDRKEEFILAETLTLGSLQMSDRKWSLFCASFG